MHLEAEQRAGEGQRRAPLAGAGLGAELLDAGLGVVPGLRHGGVGLVAAGGRDAFVLVVDLGRRAQRLLQAVGADQRGRPPQLEDLAHRLGDRDLALGGHLLQDQFHREQRRQVVRAHRLQRARVQHRRRRHRQVGGDVVPVRGHLALVEQELGGRAHGRGLLVECGSAARMLSRGSTWTGQQESATALTAAQCRAWRSAAQNAGR